MLKVENDLSNILHISSGEEYEPVEEEFRDRRIQVFHHMQQGTMQSGHPILQHDSYASHMEFHKDVPDLFLFPHGKK